jgi:hypothetical protein
MTPMTALGTIMVRQQNRRLVESAQLLFGKWK